MSGNAEILFIILNVTGNNFQKPDEEEAFGWKFHSMTYFVVGFSKDL